MKGFPIGDYSHVSDDTQFLNTTLKVVPLPQMRNDELQLKEHLPSAHLAPNGLLCVRASNL